jgi:AAA+ superfamily predicted ATPase
MKATSKAQSVYSPATHSPLHDLEAIIRSRTPLITVETNEEPQVVGMVREIARRLQLKSYRWTVTEGMRAFDPCDQPRESVVKSQEALSYIKSTSSHCLFVLLDFHHHLKDSVHVRLLKDIALTHERHFSTVILVGSTLEIPEELRGFTGAFRIPLPTPDELRGIVIDAAAEWGARHGRREVETTNKVLDLLVRNLAGLTSTDARRLALQAIDNDGAILEDDVAAISRAKFELLARDAPISCEYETARFADVGGMARLRRWLEVRRSFFRETPPENLDPPRGILLLGVQGCGKSLAAKAAAGIFGVPLLRLDFGVLYSKYYGETEKNLRKSLETAEAMSPCVLWVDEIEKGLSVDEGDDGLSRRVLGSLLTWMSERVRPVFMVATANDISRLPPEMVRKGRFDEIFFVDLPSPGNRADILQIHLRKRFLDPAAFDLPPLVEATEGFSGSEIEQAIVSAMYVARAQGRDAGHQELLEEIQQTRPLSVVMREQVAALRLWASERTVPAD